MKSGIYSIRNIVNGKIYIGQSLAVGDRKRKHFSALRLGYHRNPHLQSAFNRYGINNFEFNIIEKVPEERLDDQERLWIQYYKSTQVKYGYNLDSGGNLNKHHSSETKAKISKSRTGQKLSKETIRKRTESWRKNRKERKREILLQTKKLL